MWISYYHVAWISLMLYLWVLTNVVCLSSLVNFSSNSITLSLLILSSLHSLTSLQHSPFIATCNHINVIVIKVSIHCLYCDACNPRKNLIGLPIIFYHSPSTHSILVTLASTAAQCRAHHYQKSMFGVCYIRVNIFQ